MDPAKNTDIVLCSPGGYEYAGYSIYDAIMTYPGSVTITCYGSCMSIGVPILQAGTNRILMPNTDVMVHNGSLEASGTIEQNQVIDLAEQIKKNNERYYDIICARSGQSRETVQLWCQKDTFFTAYEAVELGLADVVIPYIKKFPTPKRPKKLKRPPKL